MKKRIIALLMTLVMVLALCACGPKDPNEGPASNPGTEATPGSEETKPPVEPGPADKPYEGVTINYWSMWSDGEPQSEVIKACAAAFEEETGCHVNIEWKGRDINTLLSAALDSEEAIDIFEDDYNRIGQVYAKWTADLTEMAEAAGYADHSYPVFNNMSKEWAGYLNAITEQAQVGGVFYNKDAFEAAGVTAEPKTWTEFLDVCKTLKDKGIIPLVQDDAYTMYSTYYHLVRYLGEDAVAELGKAGNWAGNEKAVQAFQDIIDLRSAGYLGESAPDAWPAGQTKVGLGEAAMVVMANYVTAEVNAAIGEEANWGLFNYPAIDGGAAPSAAYMGANSLAISSYSENKQAAFDFIMKLVTGEWDQKMANDCSQIPADPTNTAPAALNGTIETLLAADAPMGWCTALNTLDQWGAMKTFFTELFEGKYATGAEAAAAMDALY